MSLPTRNSEFVLVPKSIVMAIGLAVLFSLDACKCTSKSVQRQQLDPQCVLLVSECAVRGIVEEDFLRLKLINTGGADFSVPTTGPDGDLFFDPVEIRLSRWVDGRFCVVSNYWRLPCLGGGEVGLRHLSPGQMVTGTLKLKQGSQYSLKEGRYFGMLRYDLGTWAGPLAIPEIDRLHPTTYFLFDVPPSDGP